MSLSNKFVRVCDDCGREFVSDRKLDAHRARAHKEESDEDAVADGEARACGQYVDPIDDDADLRGESEGR